jgi:hypothetical protein
LIFGYFLKGVPFCITGNLVDNHLTFLFGSFTVRSFRLPVDFSSALAGGKLLAPQVNGLHRNSPVDHGSPYAN